MNFAVDCPEEPPATRAQQVGIDLGLKTLATCSIWGLELAGVIARHISHHGILPRRTRLWVDAPVGGEEFAVRAGDAWRIPADVERGGQVIEDAVAEVFCPEGEGCLLARLSSS